MAKPTNAQRLDAMEEKLDKLLAVLGADMTPPVVDDDPIPEGNPIEYPPLAAVPETPVPPSPALEVVEAPEPVVSLIGQAFANRGVPLVDGLPPVSDEVVWEAIGDTQMLAPDHQGSSGHHLTDQQTNAMYLRDLRARMRPGMTVEDRIARQQAGG